jgi:hypothetical protein
MKPIQVEITDAQDFHCFRMVLNPKFLPPGQSIEIMLHASALVDLIHECSLALSEWQKQTTTFLILQKTGLSEEQARESGLIA